MPHTEEEIIKIIEYSIAKFYGPVENFIEVYETDEVKAYLSPSIDWEEINRAGLTRSKTSEDADRMVKVVLEKFKAINRTLVGWLNSQHTTPSNFVEILESNGFKKHTEILGLVRPISDPLEIEMNNKFTFKEYSLDEMKKFPNEINTMIEKSYGMPEGTAGMLSSAVESASKFLIYNSYIAYDNENNKPVAFGSLSRIKGTTIGLLSGSGTLPDYRKQGIYSSMLKCRYEKAKKEGLEYLIIQGKAETSAPIALKNGFKKLCNLDLYVWNAKEQ